MNAFLMTFPALMIAQSRRRIYLAKIVHIPRRFSIKRKMVIDLWRKANSFT